jgi:hypothetical protein
MKLSDRAGRADDAALAGGGDPVGAGVASRDAAPADDAAPAYDAAASAGAVSTPGPSRRAVLAHRELRVLLALRAVLAILGAGVAVAAAVGLAHGGIVSHRFPAFLPGGQATEITSYSGPLLAAAIGVGAIAGLLLVSAVTDLWRRALMGASLAHSHPGLGH